jgi:hypothetical protein
VCSMNVKMKSGKRLRSSRDGTSFGIILAKIVAKTYFALIF